MTENQHSTGANAQVKRAQKICHVITSPIGIIVILYRPKGNLLSWVSAEEHDQVQRDDEFDREARYTSLLVTVLHHNPIHNKCFTSESI